MIRFEWEKKLENYSILAEYNIDNLRCFFPVKLSNEKYPSTDRISDQRS